MNEFENKKTEINIGESIKSKHVLKEIFSFLPETQKLNIIIYNKHLQNKFDINIKYYIKKSGKYKKGKRNGKGKVYDISTNTKLFKGEYLNGKKNGKGKEYDCIGQLRLECEYLNGEKNGKVKKYFRDGKLKFEGEYLNGKKMEKEKNLIIMVI